MSIDKGFYVFGAIYTAFLIIEVFYARFSGKKLYYWKDFLLNILLGLLGVANRFLTKSLWLALWMFLYKFAPFTIPQTLGSWVLLFLCNEFIYYWFHRLSHERRWLWAIHVNHHSSEYINFSTAARIPYFNFILHNIFWIPLVLIGFHPLMIFAVETISFLFAFLQHTEMIRSYGFLDAVLNFPSHHRVHHASNKEYIDKNYGNVLIIYDRLFGTFREEDPQIHIRYGITKNINSFNPVKVIFHEWVDIFKGKARQ